HGGGVEGHAEAEEGIALDVEVGGADVDAAPANRASRADLAVLALQDVSVAILPGRCASRAAVVLREQRQERHGREHALHLVVRDGVAVTPPAVLQYAAEAEPAVELQPGTGVDLSDGHATLVVEAEPG